MSTRHSSEMEYKGPDHVRAFVSPTFYDMVLRGQTCQHTVSFLGIYTSRIASGVDSIDTTILHTLGVSITVTQITKLTLQITTFLWTSVPYRYMHRNIISTVM